MILILIIIISTYIGFAYGGIFNNRVQQLKEIQKSLIYLQNEILYNSTPLPEALFTLGIKVKSPFNELFTKASTRLMNGSCVNVKEAFFKIYVEEKEKYYINIEDQNLISDFLGSLGESNLYTQDKLFNVTMKNLELNIKDAEEIAKKNIKVYRSLGISIGFMIAIFLI